MRKGGHETCFYCGRVISPWNSHKCDAERIYWRQKLKEQIRREEMRKMHEVHESLINILKEAKQDE